jgi:hypothetical protein
MTFILIFLLVLPFSESTFQTYIAKNDLLVVKAGESGIIEPNSSESPIRKYFTTKKILWTFDDYLISADYYPPHKGFGGLSAQIGSYGGYVGIDCILMSNWLLKKYDYQIRNYSFVPEFSNYTTMFSQEHINKSLAFFNLSYIEPQSHGWNHSENLNHATLMYAYSIINYTLWNFYNNYHIKPRIWLGHNTEGNYNITLALEKFSEKYWTVYGENFRWYNPSLFPNQSRDDPAVEYIDKPTYAVEFDPLFGCNWGTPCSDLSEAQHLYNTSTYNKEMILIRGHPAFLNASSSNEYLTLWQQWIDWIYQTHTLINLNHTEAIQYNIDRYKITVNKNSETNYTIDLTQSVFDHNILFTNPDGNNQRNWTLSDQTGSYIGTVRNDVFLPLQNGLIYYLRTTTTPGEKILYERFEPTRDNAFNIYGGRWKSQTFTVGTTGANENHTITSVTLYLGHKGNPLGSFNVSIRATSNGKPTGNDLTFGSIPCSTIHNGWYEISFDTPCVLLAGTQYSLIARATSCTSSVNDIYWATLMSGGYSGGKKYDSTNSGSSWTMDSTEDFLFREYGIRYNTSNPPTNNSSFTIIALPDTQEYTNAPGWNQIFYSQTQWINDNVIARNIVAVTGEGDISSYPTNTEYRVARAAYKTVENASVPLIIPVGNHEYADHYTVYNTWFPVSNYSGKSYYGGHYGPDNSNSYILFSAGGMDFIILTINYSYGGHTTAHHTSSLFNWVNTTLDAYRSRRAILVTHCLLNYDGSWAEDGLAVYEALKGNSNLFLMLCGHRFYNGSPYDGEAIRTETDSGHTIYVLLADYQSLPPYGGNGLLRMMTFIPAENRIYVQTYTPLSFENIMPHYETDADSQFNLSYNMTTSSKQYTLTINTVGNGTVTPPSGSTYPDGTIVHIEAKPNANWQFKNWSGDLFGTTNEMVTIMNYNKTITATFVSGNTLLWTAYNDLGGTFSVPPTYPRVTNIHTGSSGHLVNYATGALLGVTVTISGGSNATSIGYLRAGTDAYKIFNGKINPAGIMLYSGGTHNFTFTELDPSKHYRFVHWGDRVNSAYKTYFSTVIISDVTSFITNSSTGVTISTTTMVNDTATYCTGYNSLNGYVAGFTNINPGPDGDLTIKVSSAQGKWYSGAFMLQELQAGS